MLRDGLKGGVLVSCGYEVERRLEQSNLLVSQVGLFQMVDWVILHRVNESCYAGSLTQKGTGLGGRWGIVASPAFRSLKLSLCDVLEQC